MKFIFGYISNLLTIFNRTNLKNLFKNFLNLSVRYHSSISIVGFIIVLMFVLQIISGVMVALSLVPEPMLVPLVRDEEDLEDLFTDDWFWVHERGVDVIFVFSYLHLARKLYLVNFYGEQEFAWKSGVFMLMIIQIVTFLGLVLCATHLSDITLKIAANTLHTFMSFKAKSYWWMFTDKNLNTDTLIRLAYLHYISAFILFYLTILHSLDMHYDWKQDFNYDSLDNELSWCNEAVLNEIISFLEIMALFFLICLWLYTGPEALTYEQFMWGDVGAITDPKFNQVAPHWYFRPLMAFLLVVPHAIFGVFGLVLFFILLYFQVSLHKNVDLDNYKTTENSDSINNMNVYMTTFGATKNHIELNFFNIILYYLFVMAILYTTTFLPNGKYYQMLGGNMGLLISYYYIIIFLSLPTLRNLSLENNVQLLSNLNALLRKTYTK